MDEHQGADGVEDAAVDAAPETAPDELREFWEVARAHLGTGSVEVVTGTPVSATIPPPAWAFGDNPGLADELLGLVLEGRKTATTTAVLELADAAEPVPAVGDLSILLDGEGSPRALIRTTQVRLVTFDEVDEEYAALEGEDDRTLESWRREHERYWLRVLGDRVPSGGIGGLELVLEEFELLYVAAGHDAHPGERDAPPD